MTNTNASQWRSYVDPSTGNPYYFNTVTQQTQWRQPPDFDGPAPMGPAEKLAERQTKLTQAINSHLDDKADANLATILKQVKVISCMQPGNGQLEAQIGFEFAGGKKTQLQLKWRNNDDHNTLTIYNYDTNQIIFEGEASQRSVYRGESVYFITISPGVNELSAWLSSHGVTDCQQLPEPEWSRCPPYKVKHPSEDSLPEQEEEESEADDPQDCALPSPADPHRNTTGNNLHRFLVSLCEGLFDVSLREDMVTGWEGSLLYSIIFNQRPRHWNN